MNYQTTTNTLAPQPMSNTAGAFNTALARAQASGDPRFNMKEYDRAGVSRGKGTLAQANIAGQQAVADGVAQAYQVPLQDAVSNANNQLNYEQMREAYGQQLTGLASQNDYANTLAALQRQQNAMNYQAGVLGQIGALGGLLNGKTGGGWLDNFLGY